MRKISFILKRGERKRLLYCRVAKGRVFAIAALIILAVGLILCLIFALVDLPNKAAQGYVLRLTPSLSGIYASILVLCFYASLSALRVPKDLSEVALDFNESSHELTASINGKAKVINVNTVLISPKENTLVIKGRIAGIIIPLSSVSDEELAYICEFAKN